MSRTCKCIIRSRLYGRDNTAMGGVGISYDCNDYYDLKLWDVYDNLIYDNIVDIRYNGQMLKYEITEPECGNKCWGYILAEYKLPPQIDCPPDLTVSCTALAVLDFPPATGGCADFEVSLLSETRNTLDCHPLYTQTVTRAYIARDDMAIMTLVVMCLLWKESI